MRAPRINGVTFLTTIEFVGLFPSKTLCGNKRRNSSVEVTIKAFETKQIISLLLYHLPSLTPDFKSSASASDLFFPFIKASVCAKKLAINKR